MNISTRYSPQVIDRVVRMVFGHGAEHASQWAAVESIAAKIGCTAEKRNARSEFRLQHYRQRTLGDAVGAGSSRKGRSRPSSVDPSWVSHFHITLVLRRARRGLTAVELQKAKANAEEVGRLGEELLDHHYAVATDPEISRHAWTSSTNAIAPYDFLLELRDGSHRHVDAKSTGGPFRNGIHLSIGEIRHATSSGVPYNLCRLFEVTGAGARFRIATDVATKFLPIIDASGCCPRALPSTACRSRQTFLTLIRG